MLLNLFRFFMGYCHIQVQGPFPERFINLCDRRGILLWQMTGGENVVTACCRSCDLALVQTAAQNSGCTLQITARSGLLTLLSPLRGRWGFAVGAVLFVLILYVSSSFVWQIDVQGNTQTDTEVIITQLSQLGLKKGVRPQNLNLKATGEKLRLACPDLAGVAISYRGSHVLVKVTQRTVADKNAPLQESNLVAVKDGIITLVLCQNGKSLVKAGDAVTAGQLLISGVYEDYYGKSTITAAMGQVYAKTVTEQDFTLSPNCTVPVVKGDKKVHWGIDLFGFFVPLYLAPSHPVKVVTDYFPLEMMGVRLPLGLYRQQFYPVEFVITPKDDTAIQQEAAKLAAQLAQHQNLQDVKHEIISILRQDDYITVTCRITATENIAGRKNLSLQ